MNLLAIDNILPDPRELDKTSVKQVKYWSEYGILLILISNIGLRSDKTPYQTPYILKRQFFKQKVKNISVISF